MIKNNLKTNQSLLNTSTTFHHTRKLIQFDISSKFNQYDTGLIKTAMQVVTMYCKAIIILKAKMHGFQVCSIFRC